MKHSAVFEKVIIATALVAISSFTYEAKSRSHHAHDLSFIQNDDRIQKFRAFTKVFFAAVRNDDTNYVASHTIFPLDRVCTFAAMDTNLKWDEPPTRKYFLHHLSNLFPENLLRRISKEGNYLKTGEENQYWINVVDRDEDVESQYSWVFELKQGKFYFTQFRILD